MSPSKPPYRTQGSCPEDGVPDMTSISGIDEKGINCNLKVRYGRDQIYTCAGTILVAVNPYKELRFYGPDYVEKYHKVKVGNSEPHVYALTEAAFSALKSGDVNQSCVISGESGAGKTETAKFVLQYLCNVTSNISSWVEHQILEANTVLEAFGNAKTVRNDNSSRFGKFMQVGFDKSCMISGCVIQDYLLEQSRITVHSAGERNYHVFYQLLAAGQHEKELADQFHLRPVQHYQYLNQSGCYKIEGVDDLSRFDALRLAFNVLQVPTPMIDGLWAVISAILWLGNLEFQDIDGEKCQLSPDDNGLMEIIASLLGVPTADLTPVMILRQINVRGNVTDIPLRLQEARENRHAMAKALYSRTFSWLLSHINACTSPSRDTCRFLGVLDIFGFENFKVNSFEQLCINYANEKLQRFFNHYVFALEQESYRQEEICFSHIQFTDNTACVELIEKAPRCVLKLLSEQCHMPKGSDMAYINNLHSEFETHSHYLKGDDRRRWEIEFGIKHYAGSVMYNVTGFVDKNRDVQQDVFFELLSSSEKELVRNLAACQESSALSNSRPNSAIMANTIPRGTNKAKPTASDTFRTQLQSLVDVLQSTNPWYVRCIKPNMHKAPNNYNEELVMDQLRYLGMLDIIRIRREGYPIHMEFAEFLKTYSCVLKKKSVSTDAKQDVKTLLKTSGFSDSEWQVGKSKVFLRLQVFEPLEEMRNNTLRQAAVIIQKTWKGFVVRKDYVKTRAACLVLQHAFRGWKMRLVFLRKRRAATVIQAHLRGMFAREVATALREMRRVEAETRRREKLAEEAAERQRKEEEVQEKEVQLRGEPNERDSIFRITSSDANALTQLAEQVNSKLAERTVTEGTSDMQPSTTTSENVDLDNLFAFLSEIHVENKNSVLEEIEDHMNNLASDFDKELESVATSVAAEPDEPVTKDKAKLRRLSDDHTYLNVPPRSAQRNSINLPFQVEPPVAVNPQRNSLHLPLEKNPSKESLQSSEESFPSPPPPLETSPPTAVKNNINIHPSLPEPTEKPPPPPVEFSNPVSARIHAVVNLGLDEPIYESIQPKPVPKEDLKPPAKKDPIYTPGIQSSHSWAFNNTSASPVRDTDSPDEKEREMRRKQRVVRKLQELEEDEERMKAEETHHDLIEFAEKYFNRHERSPEGTLVATLTRKKKVEATYLAHYEMVSFYKGNAIPTSHIGLYDQESVATACTIFKDLQKYSKGDFKLEDETAFIQQTVGHGLEKEELRDEIYVQCMRQCTNNPNHDAVMRLWLVMAVCTVSFTPGKSLHKYYESFLRKTANNLQNHESIIAYAEWCLDILRNPRVSDRRNPPSSLEIAAVKSLGSIVVRFFLLDGRTKAMDVRPLDTGADAVHRLSQRLSLPTIEGWALYQADSKEVQPDRWKHVKAHEFIYDILASWESETVKQNGSPSKGSPPLPAEKRLVFRKRLFKGSREMPQDPSEINLLYAQAVYATVRCDEYPINDKVALQLAGLQLQVATGDPQTGKDEAYKNVETYLPARIIVARRKEEWHHHLLQAHRQYGTGKSEMVAKVWYLSCVMHFPLYGTSLYRVIYKGYWSYGHSLILGINWEGISLIKSDDKFVLYEYRYVDVESIVLDPSDQFLTLTLIRPLPDGQRCLVFETEQKEEIGALIASYCPSLAVWLSEVDRPPKKLKQITNEDRLRRYHNVIHCRKLLVESGVLRRPIDDSGGFLRSTLRRWNKQKGDKLRAAQEGSTSTGDGPKGFPHTFWAFTRHLLTQTLIKLPETEERLALETFKLILTYCGLLPTEVGSPCEDDFLSLAQTIMERCMKKESLFNELTLQLIKQTTDHPEVNSRVNLRHWSLLALSCSVALPQDRAVRKYLIAHLKHCSADGVSEEGKFARFAEKCVYKTMNSRRRQWPPSRQEILCTVNRRPIYARVFLMDGGFHAVEFEPAASAADVIESLKAKIGLRSTAKGYALYEVMGNIERSLTMEEKLSDVMAKWERYKASPTITTGSTGETPANATQAPGHAFLFKKHLFLDDYINLADPVEKELLYFQMLHSIRVDRFPITDMEAIMICSLRAQIELGDYCPEGTDYKAVLQHCLPPRLLPTLAPEVVALHHQSLFGMTPQEAKQAFLNIIQSWPLHRATFFDVSQCFTSNWPKSLWLAVDQSGLHLLEHRSRHVLCNYPFQNIGSISPTLTCLMVVTSTDEQGQTQNQPKPSKVILNTQQAFQIANLVREYCEVLHLTSGLIDPTVGTSSPSKLGVISV